MSDLLTDTMLDPTKRVRYTLGLVLGVDEFKQEQTYLMARDDLHQRALHGYGTVHGLAISSRAVENDVEVVVEPGLAVDVMGRHICVPSTQCAQINAWLNREDIRSAIGVSPPDTVAVYVTLCYRECPTDQVPVAGGPCRSQDDTMVASRIADDYELQLRLTPPAHRENEAGRRLAAFVRRLQVDEGADTATEEEVLEALVAHFAGDDSPPDSPPESPPDDQSIAIAESDAPDILRAIFLRWITDLRPAWMRNSACHPPRSGDDCVLLARLDLLVEESDDLLVIGATDGEPSVDVVEDDRPYLLTTQLIQEMLGVSSGGGGGGLAPGDAAGGDLRGTYPDPFVRRIQGRSVVDADPADGSVLTWIQTSDQWEPRPLPTGGDGGLTIPDVAAGLPALPFATITPENDPQLDTAPVTPGTGFRVWFHPNASSTLSEDNVPEVTLDGQGILVFAETADGTGTRPFLQQVGIAEAVPLERNVLFIRLRESATEARLLRFRFDISRMTLADSRTLLDFVTERPMKWLGHDGQTRVTVFVENVIAEIATPPSGGFDVVAAGTFDGNGDRLQTSMNELDAQPLDSGFYLLRFNGYRPDANYIVTGAALTGRDIRPAHFEVALPFDDRGIRIRVVDTEGQLNETGFMVQIGEIT